MSPALILGVAPLDRARQSRWAYLLFIALAVLTLFTAAVAAPGMTREDGLYESTTALGFALGALVAACLCLKAWAALDGPEKSVYCVAGGVSLLAFLSEVSFGARMFGWSMPSMRGGGEFDGAHDVVILMVRWAKGASAFAVAVVAAIGVATFGLAGYVLRASIVRLARRVYEEPALFRLAVSAALLFGAVGLDAYSSRRAELAEEAMETVASLGVLYAMVLGFFTKTR